MRRPRAVLGLARNDDGGFALVFVLLIATLALILVGSGTATLVNQIRPTAAAIDSGAAMAAAEAGLEDFLAAANRNCPESSGFSCSWLSSLPHSPALTDPSTQRGTAVTGADGTSTRESFYWTVLGAVPGKARVEAFGQVPQGAGSPQLRTARLVADVEATPDFTAFEYYTTYETFPPDFISDFYGPRDVEVLDPTGSSLSGSGLLHWNGTCSDATSRPDCNNPNSIDDLSVCNALYYGSSGRAAMNAARIPVPPDKVQALGTDGTFAYYDELGDFNGAPQTHWDTCDASFEPNMVMNGPLYSEDAYLVDRGSDTGNSKNSMPIFNGWAYSMWNGTVNGTQLPANPYNGGYERAYPGTDGQITTGMQPQPVYTSTELSLPPNADDAKSLATCLYTGPTRILLRSGFAYITSPGTPTAPTPPGPAYCYASTGSFTNPGGGGVVEAKVPVNTTLVYVQDPASSDDTPLPAGQRVFNLTGTSPLPPAAFSSTLGGPWSAAAGYSPTSPCPATTDPVRVRRDFDCEISGAASGAVAPDELAAINSAVRKAMTSQLASASAVQSAVQAAITAVLGPSALAAPTVFTPSADHYWTVSVNNPTYAATTSTPPALPVADPFLQTATTGGYTAQTTSVSVSIDRMKCTSIQNGKCANNALTDTPVVTGTANAKSATGTDASTTAAWPWVGKLTDYTDPNNDVTQYRPDHGDVYIDGTLKGQLTVIADHDIVATNNLTYSNTDPLTTSDGLALVADHDVRIYRPMSCAKPDDPSKMPSGYQKRTTWGYCPNDLTGVFTSPLSWPLPTNQPSTMYVPDAAPAMPDGGSIDATIFTLRGAFLADNFYRGTNGRSASIYGGLYQYHRGPTSLPYQGRPYQGSTTKMPGVVITYNYDNMRAGQNANGGLRVPWLPVPQGRPHGSTRIWNITGISAGK